MKRQKNRGKWDREGQDQEYMGGQVFLRDRGPRIISSGINSPACTPPCPPRTYPTYLPERSCRGMAKKSEIQLHTWHTCLPARPTLLQPACHLLATPARPALPCHTACMPIPFCTCFLPVPAFSAACLPLGHCLHALLAWPHQPALPLFLPPCPLALPVWHCPQLQQYA